MMREVNENMAFSALYKPENCLSCLFFMQGQMSGHCIENQLMRVVPTGNRLPSWCPIHERYNAITDLLREVDV